MPFKQENTPAKQALRGLFQQLTEEDMAPDVISDEDATVEEQLPLLIVGLFAKWYLKMNYYTLMGLLAGSTTDPPALGYANATAGNDMPAVGYATVYPVVMFLRVLFAQVLILL